MKLSGYIEMILNCPDTNRKFYNYAFDYSDKFEFINGIFWMAYLTMFDYEKYVKSQYTIQKVKLYDIIRMDVHILYRTNKIKNLLN